MSVLFVGSMGSKGSMPFSAVFIEVRSSSEESENSMPRPDRDSGAYGLHLHNYLQLSSLRQRLHPSARLFALLHDLLHSARHLLLAVMTRAHLFKYPEYS